jgi:hypothetical protein
LIFGVIYRQVPYEQVSELFTLRFSLIFLGVDGNRYGAIANLLIIETGDSIFCALLFKELNITKTSASSIGENFKFARTNLSILLEEFHESFLVHEFGKVPHNNVCLAVKILLFFLVEHNLLSINCLIVHFDHASLSLDLFDEIEVSETELLV